MHGLEWVKGLGGLALFLYGMQMMSTGMEAAAGNKLKGILERVTANRFLGVAAGAVITALIQSSSATTVMVVGFVNSGMMTLTQAVWVIMGANIGTTITGQLIALDVGAIAPIIAFVGVTLIVFIKKQKAVPIGSILAGLGILFIGMDMMSEAMIPLRDSQTMLGLLTKCQSPFIGILGGMIFTALIQSSSASVGILQALATSGVISFPSAVYVLFGQNIGTCITALLASVGTNRNAKRSTLLHILFNVIGTMIFTTICMTTPLITWIEGLSPTRPASQIANMHTLFNIATTILLLPFGTKLVAITKRLMPEKEEQKLPGNLIYLKEKKTLEKGSFGVSAITLEQIHKEIMRMLTLARQNVEESFTAFLEGDNSTYGKVEETEELIDDLNKEICRYISRVMVHEQSRSGSMMLSAYFNITGNIERISDHAMNLCGYSNWLKKKEVIFTKVEKDEIGYMQKVCDNMLESLLESREEAIEGLSTAAAMEQKMDDITEAYRDTMLDRMKEGVCSEEGTVLYSEMLTDFERIGDHALNIAQEFMKIKVVQEKGTWSW